MPSKLAGLNYIYFSIYKMNKINDKERKKKKIDTRTTFITIYEHISFSNIHVITVMYIYDLMPCLIYLYFRVILCVCFPS